MFFMSICDSNGHPLSSFQSQMHFESVNFVNLMKEFKECLVKNFKNLLVKRNIIHVLKRVSNRLHHFSSQKICPVRSGNGASLIFIKKLAAWTLSPRRQCIKVNFKEKYCPNDELKTYSKNLEQNKWQLDLYSVCKQRFFYRHKIFAACVFVVRCRFS